MHHNLNVSNPVPKVYTIYGDDKLPKKSAVMKKPGFTAKFEICHLPWYKFTWHVPFYHGISDNLIVLCPDYFLMEKVN